MPDEALMALIKGEPSLITTKNQQLDHEIKQRKFTDAPSTTTTTSNGVDLVKIYQSDFISTPGGDTTNSNTVEYSQSTFYNYSESTDTSVSVSEDVETSSVQDPKSTDFDNTSQDDLASSSFHQTSDSTEGANVLNVHSNHLSSTTNADNFHETVNETTVVIDGVSAVERKEAGASRKCIVMGKGFSFLLNTR